MSYHASGLNIGNNSDSQQAENLRRLASYRNFPDTCPICITKLAFARFSYSGYNDEVTYHVCHYQHSNWREGDNPIKIHVNQSPACPAAKAAEREAENVEIDGEMEELDIQEDGEEEEKLVCGEVDLRHSGSKRPPRRSRSRPVTAEDAMAMKAENEALMKQSMCRHCHQKKIDLLYLPCRHLVACEECGESVDDCILCNMKILGTVKTYLV